MEKSYVFFLRRRKTGKEKGRKYFEKELFFVEKKKNGEGKEGNYNGEGKIVAGRVDGRTDGSKAL